MMNNAYPLVTIGIPTYNRAASYLPHALESALRQTYPNTEIVVSDNCSTDHTESLVKGFDDSRIRYFKHSQTIPAIDNFNFCLDKADGIYFLMLHDDDMINEDFIEVCMNAACGNTQVGVIRTGMYRIDEYGKVLAKSLNRAEGLSTEDFFIAWFRGKTPMHLCATLFNTNKLKEIGGFRSKHHRFDDVLPHVQLAAKFGRVDIQEAKASFRMHVSQRANLANLNSWFGDSIILLDTMCDLVSNEAKLAVRYEGMRFFSGHNYRLACNIRSPMHRYRTYFQIFRMFDYQYSPLHFFVSQALHQIRRVTGKALRRVSGNVK